MSIRLMTKVWDSSPYEGARLILHLAMADTAHDDGEFFMSQALLAKKSRCSLEYVRLTIRDMEKRGLIRILEMGHSRGKATVYQLLWVEQPPNTVGESPEIVTESNHAEVVLYSPTLTDNPPTLTGEPPKSDGSHPSYTTVLNIHNGESQATATDLVSVPPLTVAESAAKFWWESQQTKPIGKGAWHSLLQVCKAAEQRGYSREQIINALDYIGTVPSMRQMDLILRGVGVRKQQQTSAMRNATEALEAAQRLMEQGQ